MNAARIKLAAHRIHDPSTPITVHIARLLTQAAATCTNSDELANCATCPIHEAAAELAAYLTKDLP